MKITLYYNIDDDILTLNNPIVEETDSKTKISTPIDRTESKKTNHKNALNAVQNNNKNDDFHGDTTIDSNKKSEKSLNALITQLHVLQNLNQNDVQHNTKDFNYEKEMNALDVNNKKPNAEKQSLEIYDDQDEMLISKHKLDEISKEIDDIIVQTNNISRIDEMTQSYNKALEEIVLSAIKPYLSDWLNDNLHDLVKEILTKEIKNMLSHKKIK